jgi:hypothetical protein
MYADQGSPVDTWSGYEALASFEAILHNRELRPIREARMPTVEFMGLDGVRTRCRDARAHRCAPAENPGRRGRLTPDGATRA